MMEFLVCNTYYFFFALFILCVCTSAITQLFKPLIKDKIPPEMFVIIVSLILSMLLYTGACSFMKYPIVWYEVASTIIISLLVSFVTMSGWDRFVSIIDKYKFLLSKK